MRKKAKGAPPLKEVSYIVEPRCVLTLSEMLPPEPLGSTGALVCRRLLAAILASRSLHSSCLGCMDCLRLLMSWLLCCACCLRLSSLCLVLALLDVLSLADVALLKVLFLLGVSLSCVVFAWCAVFVWSCFSWGVLLRRSFALLAWLAHSLLRCGCVCLHTLDVSM